MLLSVGSASISHAQEAAPPQPAAQAAAQKQLAPLELELKADQQGYDAQLQRFVASGNVVASLAGGRLQADRLEYDTNSRVLWGP